MNALTALLAGEKKSLAVRGQLCMQLGYAREPRALPVIADWLKDVGPRSLDDVPGPKEVQASTCYLRHIEALAMIGDERAIAVLEEFGRRIPRNIGVGGFLTAFVEGGVREALADLRDKAAFRAAVAGQAGLEQRIAPLFVHFRADPLARFRLHEDEVVRRTPAGRAVLERLAGGSDPALSAAARELLGAWEKLK